MGKIAYAHIVYRDTKQFVTVPITDVKPKKNSGSSIEPIHDSDFNKRKVYYVKWSSCDDRCEEDHEHCGYYPAFLLLLGESEEQIQTKVDEGRRLIIPNLKDCSGSEEPQLEPPRKTKRTTFTKDTVTNKNKEILQKYNARSFLSSRKSLVQNDVEDENETEHTATMDVGGMKDENIKLKGELTNSQKEIDELQKIILYLEEKNRNRQSATITTETDRTKVDSIKRELFREDDHLSSDDENFILHAQCDEAEGNPGRPSRELSNSRSEDMPKFVRLETVNHDENHHTGYETKDDQCRNERSEMMEVDLQESGTLNGNRFKAMPKIISVQKLNQRTGYKGDGDQGLNKTNMEGDDNPQGPGIAASSSSKDPPKMMSFQKVNHNQKQHTEYKGDMDQGLNETNMEDNPQGPGMSKGSCTEGTPKMMSFQKVNHNQKQHTEYKGHMDQGLNETNMEDNPQGPGMSKGSCTEGTPKMMSFQKVNHNQKQHTEYKGDMDQGLNETNMEDNPQGPGMSKGSCTEGTPKMMSFQKVNHNQKQHTEYKGDMDQGLNETNMEDNPQDPGMAESSSSKDTPKVMSLQKVNFNQKQCTEYEAEHDEHQNGDGETMEGNDNYQEPRTLSNGRSKDMRKLKSLDSIQQTRYEAKDDQHRNNGDENILQESCTSNISRSKGMPNCKRLQTVNLDVNKRARYEARDVHRHREEERDALEGNNDDENDSDESNEPIVNRRVESKMKRRKSDRIDPTLNRKILNDVEKALQYYEEQPNIDEYGREMYTVQGKKIYLGEGVEVSATAWFIIKHGKPTLFFKDMTELIWTQRKLVNRCQNLEKITTTLVDRSPMKELTPEKKRLTYKLFNDYLSEKKFSFEDRMKILRKVPVLYTEKINYLRKKHYG